MAKKIGILHTSYVNTHNTHCSLLQDPDYSIDIESDHPEFKKLAFTSPGPKNAFAPLQRSGYGRQHHVVEGGGCELGEGATVTHNAESESNTHTCTDTHTHTHTLSLSLSLFQSHTNMHTHKHTRTHTHQLLKSSRNSRPLTIHPAQSHPLHQKQQQQQQRHHH